MRSGGAKKKTEENISPTLRRYAHLQKNGILQKKEGRGTANTGRTVSENPFQRKHLPVRYVMRSLQRQQAENKSVFAQSNVQIVPCSTIESVPFVKKHSPSIENKENGKPVLKYVAVSSVHRLIEPEIVYNLSIEDNHEYFANGILVHNCDALSGAHEVLSEIPDKPISISFGRRPS